MNEFSDRRHGASSTTFNPWRCPISCDEPSNGEKQSSSQHYLSERHQRALTKRLQEQPSGNREDVGMGEGDARFKKHYDTLSLITNDLETSVEVCSDLEKKFLDSKSQTLHLSEQLNEAKEDCSMASDQIKAVSFNQQILQHDFTSCIEQIDNEKQVISDEPDGSMIWKITKVREKIYDAQSERQTSIYSPSFYTSKCGYHVRMRLYLNGDGTARGTHVSIFLVILRGKYDAVLKWPFSYRVSFCLCDQRTTMENNGTGQPKHIIVSFRPDTNSQSFTRPCSAMNIASGVPKFFPLDGLDYTNNQNLYIVNDTMYVRTFIDFLDLPRSILPFIFNLNVGLPISIRQKLIADELPRHQQPN